MPWQKIDQVKQWGTDGYPCFGKTRTSALTSPVLGKHMIQKFLLAGFACFFLSFVGCEQAADTVDSATDAVAETTDAAVDAAADAGSAVKDGTLEAVGDAADAVGDAADAVKEKVSE